MKNGGQEEVERKNFGVNQFQNVRYGRLAPAGSHNRVGRMKNLAYPLFFTKGVRMERIGYVWLVEAILRGGIEVLEWAKKRGSRGRYRMERVNQYQ